MSETAAKKNFYSLREILKKDCTYNVIFGERSNGKTYSVLMYALEQYFKNGGQLAIIRRYADDIRFRRSSEVFTALIDNGEISRLSGGMFTGVYFWTGKFYLCNYDEHGKAIYSDSDILGYAFSLSDTEHNKSSSYPQVTTILFDEFLARTYMVDEFVLFMNTVSTIIRQRTNVKIFMLGNTVNKYCPYFDEMGLTHAKDMKQGNIDVYTYGDSELKVAVEYCATNRKNHKNDYYFAFNNPKLHMITSGAWELDMYPHLPNKYRPKDIVFTFFILFADVTYQCEVIENERTEMFIYIHIKTTPLKDTDNDLIYSLEYSYKLNYNRNIFKPINKLQEHIAWFFKTDRVFYQDNSVGNAIENYLNICKRGLR